jgi:hypothetical protein
MAMALLLLLLMAPLRRRRLLPLVIQIVMLALRRLLRLPQLVMGRAVGRRLAVTLRTMEMATKMERARTRALARMIAV